VSTRGAGDLGICPTKCAKPTLFCIAATIAVYPEALYKTGLTVITAQQRRNNATILDPQIKSLNYLNNILAKIEANQAGVHDAIMLAQNGVVAECTVANIFIVKDGKIYTPPIYCGALDGITRRTIIELAQTEGYDVQEKEFTLNWGGVHTRNNRRPPGNRNRRGWPSYGKNFNVIPRLCAV
jgi:branched-chain amino acid aminotransferase